MFHISMMLFWFFFFKTVLVQVYLLVDNSLLYGQAVLFLSQSHPGNAEFNSLRVKLSVACYLLKAY